MLEVLKGLAIQVMRKYDPKPFFIFSELYIIMNKYSVVNENEFMGVPISLDASEINLDNFTSITGLYDFEIMTSEMFDLKFFLMGDIHVDVEKGFEDDGNGLYLPIYLDALFKKNKDKQFDLLMEIPPLKKSPIFKKSSAAIFMSMYKQFKFCYSSIDGGKLCNSEWPNVRFHNIDIRHIHHDLAKSNFDFPLLSLTKQIYDLTKILRFGALEIDQYKDKFNELLMLIIDLSNKKRSKSIGEYFISEIYKSEKYARYKNLEYFDDINSSIKNYINTHALSYDIFEKCKLLYKKADKVNVYEMRRFTEKSNIMFLNLRSAIMDLYTLLRILKIRSYGGKNIFIFEGVNHINTIKSVIESIDFYSTDYIKGEPLIDDYLYRNFYQLVRNNVIRISIDLHKIRIKPEIILEIIRKFTSHTADESELEKVKNLEIAISDIMADREGRVFHVSSRHPDKKMTKISYSLIKDNLY